MAVRRLHQKHCPRYGGPGICIPLHHRQVGPAVILQDNGGGLAREQLYMVLHRINNMVRSRAGFFERINTRLKVRDQDFTVGIGGPVQVMTAILNAGDTEGDARHAGTIRAELDQVQGGFN